MGRRLRTPSAAATKSRSRAGGAAHPTVPRAATPSRSAGARPPPPTWRVGAGDSFWSIAEAILERHLGRRPVPAEIGPYWAALVATNADRLPVPGQPDLLFVGDVILVPPVANGAR